MSAEESDQESNGDEQESGGDEQQSNGDEQKTPSADDLSDEGKEKVEQMQQAYDDDRPTAVLPGTDNTITGVAVNEWLDDDGNPKFGKDEEKDRGQADENKGDSQSDEPAEDKGDAS